MKEILIVDDNENNRYLLEKLLDGYGFGTVPARNGVEALALARKKPPMLVISDVLMPVMDGFELCRQWKADENLKKIPFIIYTATYTDPKDEEFALTLGADRFVVKPQKNEDIIKLINEFSIFEKALYQGTYAAKKTLGDEMDVLKQYNSVLFSKLEKKMSALEKEIVERKNAESKLERTIEELERANEELKRFSNATFHDLQEPLRMMSLYSQLLKKKHSKELNAEAAEYIDVLTKGALKMSALIKDIIDYSKLGTVDREFSAVNLNKVLAEAAENCALMIKETAAAVSLCEMPVVNGNRAEIVRLFSNLIGNSLKFVKKDQTPSIDISAVLRGDNWEFCFRDNGIGIAPKYFDKIFVLFQTLHSQDEYEGSGVGLAICKKIVENHGGRIWVESEEGKGAAFYFTLPALKKN